MGRVQVSEENSVDIDESTPQDIDWILTSAIKVTKVGDTGYVVEERGVDNPRRCEISYRIGGRMHFNGEDIDTEDFMAYVGLLDAVDESPDRVVLLAAGE
jgi:hypothetical protein